PNLRRLLDAAGRAPVRPEIYGILPKPEATELDEASIEEIERNLRQIVEFYDGSYRSPLPRPDVGGKKFRNQVKQIWDQLERTNVRRQVLVLRELGVEPIWCRHKDIPSVIEKIVMRA